MPQLVVSADAPPVDEGLRGRLNTVLLLERLRFLARLQPMILDPVTRTMTERRGILNDPLRPTPPENSRPGYEVTCAHPIPRPLGPNGGDPFHQGLQLAPKAHKRAS